MNQVFELLDKKGAYYFYKQNAFLKLIDGDTEEGNYRWSFSMEGGLLKIDTKSDKHFEFEVEILGSIDDATDTFLWGWANEQSNIPSNLLYCSRAIKTYGQQHDVGIFTEEIFGLSDVINPHYVSLLSSVLCEANAYFIGGHEKGAIVLLIKDRNFPKLEHSKLVVEDIFVGFAHYIANFYVDNHHQAFIHYIENFGLQHTARKGKFLNKSKTTIAVIIDGEEKILAKFDKRNRLVDYQMEIDPSNI